MSVVHIPEARQGLSPEQATVHNMLTENAQLIETIANYQRMGRIDEATKYNELLHRNLVYLAKLADVELVQQLEQDINGPPQTVSPNRQQQSAYQPQSQPVPTTSPSVSYLQHQQQNMQQINGHSQNYGPPPTQWGPIPNGPPDHAAFNAAMHQQQHQYNLAAQHQMPVINQQLQSNGTNYTSQQLPPR